MIIKEAYARAGLIGNPSDGYYGKTISLSIKNFRARVTLYESPRLHILPSLKDRSEFENIEDFLQSVHLYGYYGGIRLVKAVLKRFIEYFKEKRGSLPEQNFTLEYETNIPRGVGLAGSSAIITATLRCLMGFYKLKIPLPIQANLIWKAETEELGIPAGLQDRVIQVYEGLVYMDFSREFMERQGYGHYERLDPALLPPLFVAYREDSAERSEIPHSNLRERFESGEKRVVEAMKEFARYTEEVRKLLQENRGREIGEWLDRNFALRKSILPLSLQHVELVEVGKKLGSAVKFCGSGGAVIGLVPSGREDALREAYRAVGAKVILPRIK